MLKLAEYKSLKKYHKTFKSVYLNMGIKYNPNIIYMQNFFLYFQPIFWIDDNFKATLTKTFISQTICLHFIQTATSEIHWLDRNQYLKDRSNLEEEWVMALCAWFKLLRIYIESSAWNSFFSFTTKSKVHVAYVYCFLHFYL